MVDRGLIFPFNEVIRECELMKTYAKHVLDRLTLGILDETKGTLENIQSRGPTDKTSRWEIREARPLRTIVSAGESQPDAKCKHHVWALFSFVWEIRPLDEGEWKGRKHFLLDGKASTLISVMERHEETERCVARWTVDVGDHQSPGTHFHVQLNHFNEPPFPTTFDVPRLPALAMSPFLAMESAISELFQDRWKKHSIADNKDTRTWRAIHRPRLERFLHWQASRIHPKIVGSPWTALKTARPAPDMLVAEVKA